MNLKRAVVSSVVIYAIILLAGFPLNIIVPGKYFSESILLVSSLLVLIISKYLYFKDVKVKNPITDGIKLGIVIAVVMFLIEALLIVYIVMPDLGWAYFNQWNLILGYILTVFLPVISAYTEKQL